MDDQKPTQGWKTNLQQNLHLDQICLEASVSTENKGLWLIMGNVATFAFSHIKKSSRI